MAAIAADPLIAEARRRARRRRAASATVLLVAFGVGAWLAFGRGGSGASGPSPADELRALERAGRSAYIGEAAVNPDGVGWAMNGIGLWLTFDGGTHWRATAPSLPGGDVIARVCDVDFVDAAHGWIAGCDLIGNRMFSDGSDRFDAIERTTDGGRTWHVSKPNCPACGGTLSFLDSLHGFALTGAQPAPRLFATADGGVTWRFVARAPFAGSIEFLDARRGFGVTWSGRLHRTTDGGRTWLRVPLAGWASMPHFFGARTGVDAVLRRDGRAVVETTRDGGRSWSAARVPAAADLRRVQRGVSGALQFSAPTPRVWMLWAGRTLWRTEDAGASWSRVRMRVVPETIWNLTFTSPTTGWAIFTFAHGSVAALARTTNGGRDWLPLSPPVPKLPPLPKPKPVCASPCRRP